MADNVQTLDVTLEPGKWFISHPSLFGARILYLTREGVGLVQITGSVPTLQREFSFRNTGLLAYKPVFFEAAEVAQHVHIIYKL